MNQSQQLAHLMHSYATANEQQALQQYFANSNSFQHTQALAAQLNSMASINNGSNLLNNFTAFNSLAALAQAGLSTSSPISSTNSSTTGLNQSNIPMFAAAAQLLQAQQRLSGLSAASLLQQCDTNVTLASQQSPSSNSNCSSPPTCSSVTPPTPPLQLSSANNSLQLLAAPHYNLSAAASLTNASSSTNGSSTSSSNQTQNQSNSSNSNNPTSLSAAAAAAVLNGQTSLASLVANSQTSVDSSKRLSLSPDCFSMDVSNSDLNEIQQYFQLNALRQQLLLSNAGFNIPTTSSTKALSNQQQPIKNLAKLYSAINCNTIGDLNSPINSSLSSSSSSTNSLQNSVMNTNLHHSSNQAAAAAMAAAMATTGPGSFHHNAHMQLLSPNSIKTLKFSIENILSPSFGNSPAELAAVAAANGANSLTPITSIESSPMSKLFEFKAKNNFFSGNNLKKSNNSTNKNSNNLTSKQQLSNKLELVNSDINSLSSIINNLNPGLNNIDFKLNSSKRKKRSSSSLDEHSGGEKDGIESFCSSVKRKNSIDSDCSNSNSSVHIKVNGVKNLADSTTILPYMKNQSPISPKSNDKPKPLPTPEEIKNGTQAVPAWVFCTRYSDRPSSGPRSRKIKRKDKKPDEKRPRTAFTNDQLAKLKQEFEEDPYLSEIKRTELSRTLKLHESQIKIWFQNRRAKSKKHHQGKSTLAKKLIAQGLYNHSTIALDDSDDEEENRIANSSNGSNNPDIDSNCIDQAEDSLVSAK